MQYPKRIPQHILESESFKIFNSCIPSRWVLRELSERDYGIDCFIEIVPESLNLIGDIALVQLKSTTSIDWRSESAKTDACTFSGIASPTVNYWMGIQVPVFLCVVDVTAQEVYFTNAKEQIRLGYDKFLAQKSFGFVVSRSMRLNPHEGAHLFQNLYHRERSHEEFSHYFVSLLIHSQEYLDFFDQNMGRDFFLLVDEEPKMMMIHLYKTCEVIAHQLGLEWNQMSLKERFHIDDVQYKNSPGFGDLHESSITDILSNLRPVFIKALKRSLDLVTNLEDSYWLEKDRILFHYCLNHCDHIKSLKDV